MDEFAIEWVKGAEYVGVTVLSGTEHKNIMEQIS